jgi:hypothetical protein
MRRTPRPLLALALVVLAFPAQAKSHASKKSPHAELFATATVETAPERKHHKNGRDFLEFDVRLLSAEHATQGDKGGDPDLRFATDRRVHVVHDLSCGGATLTLAVGERIEIKGEYVAPPNGKDLIHFTHPADGSCGTAGGHPDGWIRPLATQKAE